jgi:hypothetical protein
LGGVLVWGLAKRDSVCGVEWLIDPDLIVTSQNSRMKNRKEHTRFWSFYIVAYE